MNQYTLQHAHDVDVERMYELRQSPLSPPQTYDLHSNDTIKFLVYYSTAYMCTNYQIITIIYCTSSVTKAVSCRKHDVTC